MNYYEEISLLILFIFIIILLLFSLESTKEGLDLVKIDRNPTTNKLIKGHYRVDDENMAQIPYGFGIDPNDETKIIPITKIGISMMTPKYNPPFPSEGLPMPNGFYQVSDSSLAMLPPNMKPKIKTIDISENPLAILYTYDIGYQSETQYYKNVYYPTNKPRVIPPEIYYVDESRTKVMFLKYGEIQDKKGFGKTTNPKLNIQFEVNYKDVKNNYDAVFHDEIEDIKKQNDMYDLNFGEVKVLDQNGNLIILPRIQTQGNVTYYNPGEFKFGASTYVPNYEDSVYLSQITKKNIFGNDYPFDKCDSGCKAYNEFKKKMDEYYS